MRGIPSALTGANLPMEFFQLFSSSGSEALYVDNPLKQWSTCCSKKLIYQGGLMRVLRPFDQIQGAKVHNDPTKLIRIATQAMHSTNHLLPFKQGEYRSHAIRLSRRLLYKAYNSRITQVWARGLSSKGANSKTILNRREYFP